MAQFETIVVERADGVVTVTMNRPAKKNAVNRAMTLELTTALREVRTDPDDRVLVLTGAGGDFCSGADLTDAGGPATVGLHYMREIADLALALHRLPKPTIAKVPGVAAGMGANLALGCDLIVASDAARFSEIFARRGLSLDCGGSWLLPRLVGLHKAKELAFFADVIDAADAERLGIVNRVVPAAELDAFVASATDRDRELRPESAVEMRRDLETIARGLPSASPLADLVTAAPQIVDVRDEEEAGMRATTVTIPRTERPSTTICWNERDTAR